jgi:hypothetical protein
MKLFKTLKERTMRMLRKSPKLKKVATPVVDIPLLAAKPRPKKTTMTRTPGLNMCQLQLGGKNYQTAGYMVAPTTPECPQWQLMFEHMDYQNNYNYRVFSLEHTPAHIEIRIFREKHGYSIPLVIGASVPVELLKAFE